MVFQTRVRITSNDGEIATGTDLQFGNEVTFKRGFVTLAGQPAPESVEEFKKNYAVGKVLTASAFPDEDIDA